ncbi:MAG: hypothetical protein A2Y38_16320 [Spirochaetes bacterium GWB1_59_5]|nr:MAG: hypothetical protein A2Y38_16320 [Spirochaetes bacterium GWB1_59_5]
MEKGVLAKPIEIIAKDAAAIVVSNKDNQILSSILRVCPGFTMSDISEIMRRGRIDVYPDKTEVFHWDGQPLIKFWPMELNMENGKITATQPYRVLEGGNQ